MIEISCFYIYYDQIPMNFTFIKYEKFMKILFQSKMIIIEINNLKKFKFLFQIYILSLLCTEDTSKICCYNDIYGVSTQIIWNNRHLTKYYDIIILKINKSKNPLLSQEPKRETSVKKQKKLLKSFYKFYNLDYIKNPLNYINDYQNRLIYNLNMDAIIQYEKKIYLLCCIRGFNRDIYTNIMKFMKI